MAQFGSRQYGKYRRLYKLSDEQVIIVFTCGALVGLVIGVLLVSVK